MHWRKLLLIRTLALSGVRLLHWVPRLLSTVLHGALYGAQAFVQDCPASPFGLQTGWAVLLWEETRNGDGPASTHQPPPENSSAHRHHLCRHKQVKSWSFTIRILIVHTIFCLILKKKAHFKCLYCKKIVQK